MKRIIFVGNPIPEDMVASSKVHNVNIADNIAQNTVIKGLQKHYKEKLTVISVSSGRGTSELDLGHGVNALMISSNNVHRALYYLSITINYTKLLNEILKTGQNQDTIIITSGPYIYMALPAMIARWKYKVKWIPFMVGSIEIPEVTFPYNLVSKLSRWTARKADGAITYVSKSARDYMPGKPFVEIFFLIDNKLTKIYQNYKPTKTKKFTITYTGALTNIYNINTVIEVIKKTGNKYRWVFAGTGPNAAIINELSRSRKYDVKHFGSVSNVEAIKLQKSSHLLLCLKGGDQSKVNQYYSKYAASGKLIEYLYSGTPVLAGDIPAFSDKIKPFMLCEKNQTASQIINDIEKIAQNYNKAVLRAANGQKYAHKYLTASHQSRKIYKFLESL